MNTVCARVCLADMLRAVALMGIMLCALVDAPPCRAQTLPAAGIVWRVDTPEHEEYEADFAPGTRGTSLVVKAVLTVGNAAWELKCTGGGENCATVEIMPDTAYFAAWLTAELSSKNFPDADGPDGEDYRQALRRSGRFEQRSGGVWLGDLRPLRYLVVVSAPSLQGGKLVAHVWPEATPANCNPTPLFGNCGPAVVALTNDNLVRPGDVISTPLP